MSKDPATTPLDLRIARVQLASAVARLLLILGVLVLIPVSLYEGSVDRHQTTLSLILLLAVIRD